MQQDPIPLYGLFDAVGGIVDPVSATRALAARDVGRARRCSGPVLPVIDVKTGHPPEGMGTPPSAKATNQAQQVRERLDRARPRGLILVCP
ncbi:MAG: hypothetical protein ACJAWM_002051 [Sulfitobacter sp.]